jgi:hypothetical protein
MQRWRERQVKYRRKSEAEGERKCGAKYYKLLIKFVSQICGAILTKDNIDKL